MPHSENYNVGKLAVDNCSLRSSEAWSELIKEQQKPFFFTLENSDDICFDFTSPPVQNTSDPKDFASRSRKVNGQKIHVPTCNGEAPRANDQKLSTTERIRMAGQRFIEFYSSKADEISQLNHPFGVPFCGLSDDEVKDIELLFTLLASAEETGQKQFNRARKLIQLCSNTCLKEGSPVERLVYYFSEAILIKINHKMGRLARDGRESMQMFDLQEALMNVDTCIFAFHLKVPLSQVCKFSSIHTIIENLNKAIKIHVIDLEIRTGMQYILLMQAIASHSEWHIESIKITAIGTILESKIRDTCKCLADFAKSMNIPFSFKIIMINPCVMVMTEVEANHTSPIFVDRFIEALFFYGALFDSMSDCLATNDLNRKVMESVFYGNCIHNIVAAEGDERIVRHTGVDVWRKFFQRFGMLEIELSDATLNETNLMMGKFNCGNSCSLLVDGGCFLVEWKGVPIFSVSAWKFMTDGSKK